MVFFIYFSLKHKSLLIDSFQIMNRTNFLEHLAQEDLSFFLQKCLSLIESRYEVISKNFLNKSFSFISNLLLSSFQS